MRLLRIATTLSAALLLCTLSRAQELREETAPGHLAIVEGSASLTREGEHDEATAGIPIVSGDVLRTERGRLEILLPDGSALDLDEFSTIELLSPTLYRLSDGRLQLTIARTASPTTDNRIAIDTALASAEMLGPGEYQLSLRGTPSGMQAEFAVIRGAGILSNERGSISLRAGEQSVAWNGGAPTSARTFNSAQLDAFGQWSVALRNERGGGRSSQYLPPDLRMYGGALDRNGAWEYESSSAGYVWYPTVDAEWQPYDDGYWSAVPAYGWTWIGAGAWSWPTHHYGRWGYQRSRWFWIPDRRWAPAWVSWGAAPGYVSWCPLGRDNRPVFALSVSYGSRWDRGWMVINREHFGDRGRNVRQYSVRSLPMNTPFVSQTSAPLPPRRGPNERRIIGGGPAHPSGPATSGFARPRTMAPSPDRGRPVGERNGQTTPTREVRPNDAPNGGPGRDRGRQPTTSPVPADTPPRSAPTAVPRERTREGSPSVIYSSPTPPRGDDQQERSGRPSRSGSSRSAGAAPPVAPPAPAVPAAPTESRRPRYGAGAPAAVQPAPPAASAPPPAAPERESRRERHAEPQGTSGSGRASSGAQSSGDGQRSSGREGGHAQGRRR